MKDGRKRDTCGKRLGKGEEGHECRREKREREDGTVRGEARREEKREPSWRR